MKKQFKPYLALFCLVYALGTLTGCKDDGSGDHTLQWKEEVPLHNGAIIWVDRTADYKTSGAMGGGGGGTDAMVMSITIPQNSVAEAPPVWDLEWSLPILLDYDDEKQTWFIISTFIMCHVWQDWGAPKLPYRQYDVQDGEWVVVPLNEELIGRKTNLTSNLSKIKTKMITTADREKSQGRSSIKYKMIVGRGVWLGCGQEFNGDLK